MSEQHMAITKRSSTASSAPSTKVARVLATLLLLVGAVFAAPACETYDAPPQVFVIDLVDAWKSGAAQCRKAGLDPARFSPALAPLAAMPPTLILAGAEDPISSAASNRRFVGRMATAARDAELFTFAGKAHALFTRKPADPHLQAVLGLGTRFLQDRAWLAKTPLPPLPEVKYERTSAKR